MADLLEELIIDRAIDSRSIVECQRGVQSEALEVGNWIDVDGAILGVVKDLFNADVAFKIEDRHV